MKKAGSLTMVLLVTLSPVLAAQEPEGQFAETRGDFTMALVGDAIITRPLRPYDEPQFLRVFELIRSADAAFANLEMLFHDYESYPMYESGGTYMRADPALVDELVWAGFDMVGRANNHTGDYGVAGMRMTTKYVDEAGLVQAGVGESLPAAREAHFLETSRGRVALISTASTFPEHSTASRSRGDVPARPGLSPLHHSTTRVATADQLERLGSILDEMDVNHGGGPDRMRVLGTTFVAGSAPAEHTEPDPDDMREIAAVVDNAARLADQVVVSIHAHESGGRTEIPAEFLVTFAHAMIDAGATVFVGHGPHVLRGVEIYKGRPIFYSLGDFVFQNETLLRLPEENYAPYDLGPDEHVADFNARRYRNDTSGFPANPEIWEAVIARPRWQGGRLAEVALYPITLGYGQPAWVRGRPQIAQGAVAAKILGNLVERSAAFGTTIDVRDGVGYVRLR